MFLSFLTENVKLTKVSCIQDLKVTCTVVGKKKSNISEKTVTRLALNIREHA